MQSRDKPDASSGTCGARRPTVGVEMSRSFRFVPPEPRPDALTRPRLLRSLIGRWNHRVTALTGGPGLGKTTLLAQAIAENRMAPRGDDVWIGLEPPDADADQLARVVTRALDGARERRGNGVDGTTALDHHAALDHAALDHAGRTVSVPDPAAVADAVWHRAPTEACLVLDDVHLLPAGSTGATWLADLVQALPANGHLVLAGRAEPPVPLGRFGTQGAVLRLFEDDLRFDDEELSGFALVRGLDPGRFGDTGGWPAMAELVASVEHRLTGNYLWEEVLEPLGTVRRHVLAVLSDIGGADDELASAAVGTPVDLARAFDGVPLVARGIDGWYQPHGLWRTAPGIALTPTERAEIRRRAAGNLSHRGRFDEAFRLVQEAGLWDVAPTVLRAACLSSDRLVSSQLGRWLSASSEAVRSSPAGRLATGLHAAFTRPEEATEPLQLAAQLCRDERDVDGELTAIAQMGMLAWWRVDLAEVAELMTRVVELEATGNPRAVGVATIARAVVADLAGNDAAVLGELSSLDPEVVDPAWSILAGFLQGLVHLDLGEPEPACAVVDDLLPTADPAMRYILDALRLRAWWSLGRVDDVLAGIPPVMAAAKRSGNAYNLYLGGILASIAYSHAGDVGAAQGCLDDAMAVAPPPSAGRLSVHSAIATASLELAIGGEDAATDMLEEAAAVHGIDRGQDRHSWRQALSLSYVLLPGTRRHWDEMPLRGYLRVARDLGAAVVAVREGDAGHRLRALEVPEPGFVRGVLHHRFGSELALALAAIGRSEGRTLLDALGPPGRSVVRALAGAGPRQARAAKALLAAVPAPPPRHTHLAVLGPLVLRRDGPDGDEVLDPDLRRRRVQALLAFLVGHRRTNRAAITAALWPDLDERSAGNNLGVTLNHLLRALEPWRDSGEPAYLVRVDGPSVQLVSGEHLAVDVDLFDTHLAAAARAEADGTPSLALQHDLAAVDLYRGDLHEEVPEVEWLVLDREHYRSRFVGAAVRAGQLLLGRGDAEQAGAVAHRALAVDRFAEDAYAVLVGAALARGDRSGARRMLERCRTALHEIGADLSAPTERLARRLPGAAGPADTAAS
jgi:DNA-binding SARP family transcriptional activator